MGIDCRELARELSACMRRSCSKMDHEQRNRAKFRSNHKLSREEKKEMLIDDMVTKCMRTFSKTFDSIIAEKEKNRLKKKEMPPKEVIEIEAPPWEPMEKTEDEQPSIVEIKGSEDKPLLEELKDEEVVPPRDEPSLEEESSGDVLSTEESHDDAGILPMADTPMEEHVEIEYEAPLEEAIKEEELLSLELIVDLPLEIVPCSLSIVGDDSRTNRFEEGEFDMNPIAMIPIIQVSPKISIIPCNLEDLKVSIHHQGARKIFIRVIICWCSRFRSKVKGRIFMNKGLLDDHGSLDPCKGGVEVMTIGLGKALEVAAWKRSNRATNRARLGSRLQVRERTVRATARLTARG